MTLGRKIEKPVAKKADPIAAFERGDHSLLQVGVDPADASPDETTFAVFTEAFSSSAQQRRVDAAPELGYPYGGFSLTALESMAAQRDRMQQLNDLLMKAMADTAALSINPSLVISSEQAREMGLKAKQTATVTEKADRIREQYARNINREYETPWAGPSEEAERAAFAKRFGELKSLAKVMGRAIGTPQVCEKLGLPFQKLSTPDLRRVLAFMEDWVKPDSYGSAGAFA